MTTEHSQDRKCLIFPEGGKPDVLENPRGTAENQRTTQLTYGPCRESNRGHLGERRTLYAHANHATLKIGSETLRELLFKNGSQTLYELLFKLGSESLYELLFNFALRTRQPCQP